MKKPPNRPSASGEKRILSSPRQLQTYLCCLSKTSDKNLLNRTFYPMTRRSRASIPSRDSWQSWAVHLPAEWRISRFTITRQRFMTPILTGPSAPPCLPGCNRQTASHDGNSWMPSHRRSSESLPSWVASCRFVWRFRVLRAVHDGEKPTSIGRGEAVGFGLSRPWQVSGRLLMEHRESEQRSSQAVGFFTQSES